MIERMHKGTDQIRRGKYFWSYHLNPAYELVKLLTPGKIPTSLVQRLDEVKERLAQLA